MKAQVAVWFIAIFLLFCSCSVTKDVSLANDEQLIEGYSLEEGYEHSFESYREGASGGSNSKSSGGCGCQ